MNWTRGTGTVANAAGGNVGNNTGVAGGYGNAGVGDGYGNAGVGNGGYGAGNGAAYDQGVGPAGTYGYGQQPGVAGVKQDPGVMPAPAVYREKRTRGGLGRTCCRLLCCLLCLLLTLIVAVGILVLVLYFVLKPHDPSLTIESAQLRSFNITNGAAGSNGTVNTNILMLVQVHNPNKMALHFGTTNVTLYDANSTSTLLAQSLVPAFVLDKHQSRNISVDLVGANSPVTNIDTSLLTSQYTSGTVPLLASIATSGKLHIWGVTSPTAKVRTQCTLTAHPQTNNITKNECHVAHSSIN